jgi:tripartite ATP-independent transporter DctM subunit
VAATATLAQIFPPATVLVLLGDQMSHAWQASQLKAGNFAPAPVTLIDIFAGAIVPGLVLVLAYMAFVLIIAWLWPQVAPGALLRQERVRLLALLRALALPLMLIIIVLGSILMGIASPTEAAAIGALGATLLALLRPNEAGVTGGRVQLFGAVLWPVMRRTAEITSMIFLSLVFRGFGGDGLVERSLSQLPGGPGGAILIVMVAMFLLGFVMDAFEIIFVIVPIVAPPLLAMGGIDPVWLAVMMAVNLQTSYMHPPLGPTLFFLRGVAPPEITTRHIYVGIIPFVVIQLAMLAVLWFWPGLVLALPRALYGG